MNFLDKIFSINQSRKTLLNLSAEHVIKLGNAEMDSVLGGRPLVNPLDESVKRNHENNSKEI